MFAIPWSTRSRARATRFAPAILLPLFAIVAVFLAGCSSKSDGITAPAGTFSAGSPFAGPSDGAETAPVGAGVVQGASSYPLAVGNRWDYELNARVVVVPSEGPPHAQHEQGLWRSEIVGTATIGSHTYHVLEERDPQINSVSLAFYVRQDRDGYYEVDSSPVPAPAGAVVPGSGPRAMTRATLEKLDGSLAASPHRAAYARAAARVAERLELLRGSAQGRWSTTGAEPFELTFLRFPLKAGSEWVVRESPRFGRAVVGRDEMMLPAGRVIAWRLRGVSELYGTQDEVHFWYGRQGLVRIHLHAELDAVDDTGNVIGRAIGEYDQSLARFTGSQATSHSAETGHVSR